jgi:hypothetical protein
LRAVSPSREGRRFNTAKKRAVLSIGRFAGELYEKMDLEAADDWRIFLPLIDFPA